MPEALLITGARVYTADPSSPWAEAVATRGETIVYVGDEREARRRAGNAEEISVPGGLVVPGLNDSHIHLSHGAHALTVLALDGIADLPTLRARLGEYAAAHPDKSWIEGYGALYEPFSGLDRPARAMLDDVVPDRPVYLRAFDTHSAWCNSEALRRAGIERGADVERPSEVVVDPASGLATGMLKEREAHGLIERLLPEPTEREKDDALVEAMRYVNRLGITSIQNMDANPARFEQYERLRARGSLTVRACHYLTIRGATAEDRLTRAPELQRRYRSPWNRMAGIKLFIDGVVESKTALMFEPYCDGSDDAGAPDMDPEVYRDIVLRANASGLNVATHAIGDRGIRLSLDACQLARSAHSNRGKRHRIEHIEVIKPDDIPRFASLGMVASMQPVHSVPLGHDIPANPWVVNVGPARAAYAFPWRSLVETGAHLAFGSDWPVVTPDPRLGLLSALTRTKAGREPRGGWQPQQCVTLAQAIDAYTRGAAYAEGQERTKGMLRPGMAADLTVFGADLFALSPDSIPEVELAATLVGGRVVHLTE